MAAAESAEEIFASDVSSFEAPEVWMTLEDLFDFIGRNVVFPLEFVDDVPEPYDAKDLHAALSGLCSGISLARHPA